MRSKKIIQTITLPKIIDESVLCFAQTPTSVPFPIKRVYYILSPKKNRTRGAHAHHQTNQILFCLQGQVKLVLDDGNEKESITLTKPNLGVLLPPLVWHEMHDLDEKTVILVLASERYNPTDYIRNYDDFKKIASQKKPSKNSR